MEAPDIISIALWAIAAFQIGKLIVNVIADREARKDHLMIEDFVHRHQAAGLKFQDNAVTEAKIGNDLVEEGRIP